MTITECRHIFALLSEYLDRELTAELCDQITGHIQDCPPCVEFVESLRKTTDLCRRLELPEKPGPLPEETRRKLLAAYEKLRSNLL